MRYFGLAYDHIVYVAGLLKAFSSLGVFVTCRSPAERTLFSRASTMIFSVWCPSRSSATALAGLRINDRRATPSGVTSTVSRCASFGGAREAGLVVENEIGFPALTVVIGGIEQVVDVRRIAVEHGILFTPAAFPPMPLERGGLRLSVTAAHTDADVDRLLVALDDIAARVTDRTSLSPRP